MTQKLHGYGLVDFLILLLVFLVIVLK